jgi:2-C-methyl-D-erythritol 4-phosphate cytidylyltransferase
MQKFAIIVAGGSGSRMKSDIPKQFLVLKGKPVLFHTIDAFQSFDATIQIKLVLPESQFDFWYQLCQQYHYQFKGQLVVGGQTRYHSVQNGLRAIVGEEGIVAVHDGVRPLISSSTLEKAYEQASLEGTSVVSVSLKDSLRQVKADGSNEAAFREAFKIVQTPQIFRLDWMRKAFTADWIPEFTDCASVMEYGGYKIHLVEGEYTNIKITTPEDLILAEAFLEL